ncbi:MAG: hypothetical protein H8F28_24535 [Fibrella sp.]|nr:hypothetical protein [Armatimonadota bacterium]
MKRYVVTVSVTESEMRYLKDLARVIRFNGYVRGILKTGPVAWRDFAGWFLSEFIKMEQESEAYRQMYTEGYREMDKENENPP